MSYLLTNVLVVHEGELRQALVAHAAPRTPGGAGLPPPRPLLLRRGDRRLHQAATVGDSPTLRRRGGCASGRHYSKTTEGGDTGLALA